jgi:pimeloyl-ACP methyl ester carboxylesterase
MHKFYTHLILIQLLGVLTMFFTQPSPAPAEEINWINSIRQYPVGQSDPFTDELHRLQATHLTQVDLQYLATHFPEASTDEAQLFKVFDGYYQSLALGFDPLEYEESGLMVFNRNYEADNLEELSPDGSERTYRIHLDRYADPSWDNRYRGSVLLIPGTGSYGGNYIRFCLALARKGYIVYTIDLPGHGRSHLHKIIRRSPEGVGTGVFLTRGISKSGEWQFDAALEEGWEEVAPCRIKPEEYINTIQAIGRRIVIWEKENLAHLAYPIPETENEEQIQTWYGKSISQLTHLTLIGTSQGGETAFWSADPRATGKGQEAFSDILYPFDSVICHDVYGTSFTAPQSGMRWLRSGFTGSMIEHLFWRRDSLWRLTDWQQYYDLVPLFVRASDRWVRWRYPLDDYRGLLRFGEKYAANLPHMKIPVLVVIGKGDLLYPDDQTCHRLVATLFKKMERPTPGDSLWYVQYQTPPGTHPHQLLVSHTLPMVDLVDGWIGYRHQGPGSRFDIDPAVWQQRSP